MIQQEQALKQNYYAAFRDKNLDWWQQEITRMKNKNDVALNAMYNRLLGFISLACYSMSGNAIAQNQWDTAKRMLAIYQLADPENSDQPFFEACFFAKQGETAAAMASLKRAVALGLKDPAKILNEPALSSLQSNPEFISLINSLQQ